MIENFLPGAVERFGLDHASVSATNPGVVSCAIRGYPHDHPNAARPGYDFLMQGIGGIMSMQGEPDGQPMKVAVAIADIVAGLFAGNAILAALVERSTTGTGRELEVSLLDAQVAWLANRAGDWLIGGIEPERLGNAHPSIVPYETFEASDGYVNLAIGNDEQFARFCREAGRDDLADDTRFQTNRNRVIERERAGRRATGHDRHPYGRRVGRDSRSSGRPRWPGAHAPASLRRARRAYGRDRRAPDRGAASAGALTDRNRRRTTQRATAPTTAGRAHRGGARRGRL